MKTQLTPNPVVIHTPSGNNTPQATAAPSQGVTQVAQAALQPQNPNEVQIGADIVLLKAYVLPLLNQNPALAQRISAFDISTNPKLILSTPERQVLRQHLAAVCKDKPNLTDKFDRLIATLTPQPSAVQVKMQTAAVHSALISSTTAAPSQSVAQATLGAQNHAATTPLPAAALPSQCVIKLDSQTAEHLQWRVLSPLQSPSLWNKVKNYAKQPIILTESERQELLKCIQDKCKVTAWLKPLFKDLITTLSDNPLATKANEAGQSCPTVSASSEVKHPGPAPEYDDKYGPYAPAEPFSWPGAPGSAGNSATPQVANVAAKSPKITQSASLASGSAKPTSTHVPSIANPHDQAAWYELTINKGTAEYLFSLRKQFSFSLNRKIKNLATRSINERLSEKKVEGLTSLKKRYEKRCLTFDSTSIVGDLLSLSEPERLELLGFLQSQRDLAGLHRPRVNALIAALASQITSVSPNAPIKCVKYLDVKPTQPKLSIDPKLWVTPLKDAHKFAPITMVSPTPKKKSAPKPYDKDFGPLK